jgi:hypothetical protein
VNSFAIRQSIRELRLAKLRFAEWTVGVRQL